MRRFRIGLVGAAVVVWAAEVHAPRFAGEQVLSHIKYLASEDLKGRGTGTPELEKAAGYIARQFHQAGLQPVDGKSYYQAFQVTTNARLGKENHFTFSVDGNKKTLDSKQFGALNFSSSGKVEGTLVFAGYGITANEYNYDDYAGLDVRDKIVVILRHEPQEFDEKSVFAGKVYTEHAQFPAKATNAKLHGARAVILVNDIGNHSADSDDLEPFGRTVGPSQSGIPFVQVKADVAGEWLATGPHGPSLKSLQAEIDRELTPQSFALPETVRVSFQLDVKREIRTVHNVAGYLPGETAEHIVIGAHYDHLGLGEQYSMAPSQAGTPHVGADDNASGTAGVIELARYFGSQQRHKRGILFMTFAAEELGLLGSSYYVSHPRYPLTEAVAMLNMDMIGRIRDGKVYLGGLGTGTTFKTVFDDVAKATDLKIELSDQAGYGSSDHTSFTTKQVPVLFFFSGLHSDYHKPSDTWDKIDASQAAKLLEVVSMVADRLTTDGNRPQFVRVAPPAKPLSAGSSTGSGYGPYFGSIPDMAEQKKGVRFADLREGSPAAKAGLKAGDTMVEFDGKQVDNLQDFTYLLRSKQVGDKVKVKVLREGVVIETEVVLERRR